MKLRQAHFQQLKIRLVYVYVYVYVYVCVGWALYGMCLFMCMFVSDVYVYVYVSGPCALMLMSAMAHIAKQAKKHEAGMALMKARMQTGIERARFLATAPPQSSEFI